MGRKLGELTLKLLEAAETELRILYETRSSQRVMILEGREGILRIIRWKDRQRELARIRRIARKRYIQLKKEGDELICTLTDEGRITLRRQARTYPERKDGKCLYVFFDIPENLASTRRVLRRTLKSLGFEMIQKSVWRTKKDILGMFMSSKEIEKFKKWIRIVVGEEI